ncbi:MAG: histidinol-phosphatase [Candidatus Sumerlaeota bacterium]|nr:histidinol-phosphatase [Candidatus Sumerlaeota bacterium]
MNNYHTHTYRCKHASGDIGDYARFAQNQGGRILGISDHTPLPDGRWSHVRMSMNELDDYVRAIEEAQSHFAPLTILKGMECEWSPEYRRFYEEELLGKRGFQYLITGAHWFPYEGGWVGMGDCWTAAHLQAFARYVIQAMESRLFAFIAHPDVIGVTPRVWDEDTRDCAKEIFAAAEALDIPLEINGYGMRKPLIETSSGRRLMYPWTPFWELAAEYKIKVVCNSDAHRPQDVMASIEEGQAFARRLGLTVIEELKIKN